MTDFRPEDYDNLTSEDGTWVIDTLGICGCGFPEEAMVYVRDVLQAFHMRRETGGAHNEVDEKVGGTGGLMYFVLGQMDERGWLEHGGNISGSWLTPAGELVLAKLAILTGQLDVDVPGD